MKNHRHRLYDFTAKGFTLIEMLVVLVIMATLIGVGAHVMKNAASAQGVDTGASLVSGVFEHARSLAKNNGIGARVVVFNGGVGNEESHSKHLRYIGIVRKEDNNTADTSDDVWSDRLVSKGILLPPNVFFNAKLSGTPQTMQVQIPGLRGSHECYYYEFNGEGYLTDPDGGTANVPRAQFILQSGKLLPTNSTPRVTEEGSRDVGGFGIWPRGNMTRYQSPDQISQEDPTF